MITQNITHIEDTSMPSRSPTASFRLVAIALVTALAIGVWTNAGDPAAPSQVEAPAPLETVTYRKTKWTTIPFTLLANYKLVGTESEYWAYPEEIPILQKLIPADVCALNGKLVHLTGFMFPLKVSEKGTVEEFLLIRDRAGCCFGKFPPLNGIVYCYSKDGVPYAPDVPLELYGTMEVGAAVDAQSSSLTLYRLRVSHCELPIAVSEAIRAASAPDTR